MRRLDRYVIPWLVGSGMIVNGAVVGAAIGELTYRAYAWANSPPKPVWRRAWRSYWPVEGARKFCVVFICYITTLR